MSEQQCVSSPATSSTSREDETFSDTTLDDVLEEEDDQDELYLSCPGTLIESPSSHCTDTPSNSIFPIHLLSSCSSAGRSAMCTFSQTLTSQQSGRVVLELKGTSRHTKVLSWCGGLGLPVDSPASGALDPLGAPSSLRSLKPLHTTMQAQHQRRTLEPG